MLILKCNNNDKLDNEITNAIDNKIDDSNEQVCENSRFDNKSLVNYLKFLNNSKTVVVFQKCEFENFANCIKSIFKNKLEYKNIKKIYFLECLPENEINTKLNYNDKDIKIIFNIEEDDIEKIKLQSNNKAFITAKRDNYIGFTVNYNRILVYMVKIISILAFCTSASSAHFTFIYYLLNQLVKNDQKEKKEIIDETIASYMIKVFKDIYFQDFFKELNNELNNSYIIKYNICVLKNEIDQKTLIRMCNKNKDIIKKIQMYKISGLFFNLASNFYRDKETYIYIGYKNIFKPELQELLEDYINNLINDDYKKFDAKKMILIKNQYCVFATINNRLVIIYNISKEKTFKIFKEKSSIKEKNVYTNYNELGVNYIIFKLIELGKSKEEAIKHTVKLFIQYILSIK